MTNNMAEDFTLIRTPTTFKENLRSLKSAENHNSLKS